MKLGQNRQPERFEDVASNEKVWQPSEDEKKHLFEEKGVYFWAVFATVIV